MDYFFLTTMTKTRGPVGYSPFNKRSLYTIHDSTQPTQSPNMINPMLDQCWSTVRDAGPPLTQQWKWIDTHDTQYVLGRVKSRFSIPIKMQKNTRYQSNAGIMLGHRLRRWPNIMTALCRRLILKDKWPFHSCPWWNSGIG